jgi:hypothetical protein
MEVQLSQLQTRISQLEQENSQLHQSSQPKVSLPKKFNGSDHKELRGFFIRLGSGIPSTAKSLFH